jgi:hypothetical protein
MRFGKVTSYRFDKLEFDSWQWIFLAIFTSMCPPVPTQPSVQFEGLLADLQTDIKPFDLVAVHLQSSADVKRAWCFTSTVPYVLLWCLK